MGTSAVINFSDIYRCHGDLAARLIELHLQLWCSFPTWIGLVSGSKHGAPTCEHEVSISFYRLCGDEVTLGDPCRQDMMMWQQSMVPVNFCSLCRSVATLVGLGVCDNIPSRGMGLWSVSEFMQNPGHVSGHCYSDHLCWRALQVTLYLEEVCSQQFT